MKKVDRGSAVRLAATDDGSPINCRTSPVIRQKKKAEQEIVKGVPKRELDMNPSEVRGSPAGRFVIPRVNAETITFRCVLEMVLVKSHEFAGGVQGSLSTKT